MSRNRGSRVFVLVLSAVLIVAATVAVQAKGFLSQGTQAQHDQKAPLGCRGAVTLVQDIGYEGIQSTTHNFINPTGGGESLRFDKTPVLSTKVELKEGCLNAHFSAIVGNEQYGVSPVALFQVTLTPTSGGPPQHMYGHFETPYGIYGPAVAVQAEEDVDTFGSNFFQRIGDGPDDVKPGTYYVDVWWAGGPTGAGGAIGAAFVLKLYQ